MTSPIQIMLDPEESEILSGIESDAFVVIHRASDTARPDLNRRWVLTLVPCSTTEANAALGTITGTHRATRIKSTSKA